VSRPLKYFLLSETFWVVMDYTTAFNPDFQHWLAHMPLIYHFYDPAKISLLMVVFL